MFETSVEEDAQSSASGAHSETLFAIFPPRQLSLQWKSCSSSLGTRCSRKVQSTVSRPAFSTSPRIELVAMFETQPPSILEQRSPDPSELSILCSLFLILFLFGFTTEASWPVLCVENKNQCRSVTGKNNRQNVRGATGPSQEHRKHNDTVGQKTYPVCSRRQEVDTAQHTRKRARTPCLALGHRAGRDSHENQLLLPPAEESASTNFSNLRSASYKVKVGLLRCALQSSCRTSSLRLIIVA